MGVNSIWYLNSIIYKHNNGIKLVVDAENISECFINTDVLMDKVELESEEKEKD